MPDEPDSEREPVVAASVEPMQINSRRVVVVGTAIFAIGFVALLPCYDWLGRHHHRVWLWTCLAGVGVGLFGYALTLRHKSTGRITR